MKEKEEKKETLYKVLNNIDKMYFIMSNFALFYISTILFICCPWSHGLQPKKLYASVMMLFIAFG